MLDSLISLENADLWRVSRLMGELSDQGFETISSSAKSLQSLTICYQYILLRKVSQKTATVFVTRQKQAVPPLQRGQKHSMDGIAVRQSRRAWRRKVGAH